MQRKGDNWVASHFSRCPSRRHGAQIARPAVTGHGVHRGKQASCTREQKHGIMILSAQECPSADANTFALSIRDVPGIAYLQPYTATAACSRHSQMLQGSQSCRVPNTCLSKPRLRNCQPPKRHTHIIPRIIAARSPNQSAFTAAKIDLTKRSDDTKPIVPIERCTASTTTVM